MQLCNYINRHKKQGGSPAFYMKPPRRLLCDVKALKRAYALYRFAFCDGVDGQERRYERGHDGCPEHHYPRKGAEYEYRSAERACKFGVQHAAHHETCRHGEHEAYGRDDDRFRIEDLEYVRAARTSAPPLAL